MLSTLFEWLVLGPFVSAFRAATWMLLPTKSAAVSWLKLAAGVSLAAAATCFFGFAVMLWIGPLWGLAVGSLVASIACCHLAGFFAMLIERVHRT